MKAIGIAFVTLTMAAVLFGCGRNGQPTYHADGKVAFPDGTPLAGGCVEFRPIDSAEPVTARGHIQADGTFRLGTFTTDDGAVEGEHAVIVMPPPAATSPDAQFRLQGVRNPALPAIDPRFLRFEDSGLKFSVTRDPAQNHFAIQVDRPQE